MLGSSGTAAIRVFATPGGVVAASNLPMGALYASIIKRLGIDVSTCGSPAGSPIAEL